MKLGMHLIHLPRRELAVSSGEIATLLLTECSSKTQKISFKFFKSGVPRDAGYIRESGVGWFGQ